MRYLKIIFFIAVIFIAFIAFLPALLSTKLGNQFITSILSNGSYQQVQLTDVHLSWLGPQNAKKIFLKDRTTTISLEDVVTHSSLFNLLEKKIKNTAIGKLFLSQHGKISLKNEKESTYKLIGNLEIKDGEIVLQSEEGSETKIEKISINLNREESLFKLQAEFDHPKQKGSIQVFLKYQDKPQIMAEIKALPTSIFSSFKELSPLISIGESVSANILLSTDEEQHLTITVQSDALNVKAEGKGKESLSFTQDSNLIITLSPTKLQELGASWLFATVLEPLTLTIRPYSLKIQSFEDFQLNAGFEFSTIAFLLKEQKYSIDHLHGEILWGNEKKISFESDKSFPFPIQINGYWVDNMLHAQIKTNDLSSILTKLKVPQAMDLGKSLTVNLEANSSQAFGKAKGDLLDVEFYVKKTYEGYFSHTVGDLRIDSAQKSILGNNIHFIAEKEIKKGDNHFYLSDFKVSFDNTLGKGVIEGTIGSKFEPMSLATVEANGSYFLSQRIENEPKLKGSVIFFMSGRENSFFLQLKLPKIAAKFEARDYLNEGKFDKDHSTFHLQANAKDLPTNWLDILFKKNTLLTSLLGEKINLTINAVQDPKKEHTVEIAFEVDGVGLHSQGTLRTNHQFNVSEDSPIFLHYELNPSRYRQLIQRLGNERLPTLILTKPATINLIIFKLVCPKESLNIKEFLCQTGFEGKINLTPMTFVDPEKSETVIFNEINGTITGESFSQSIHLELQSQMQTSSPLYPQATFFLQADLIDLFNNDASINKEGTTLKINSHLTPFSTSAFLGILPLKQNEREKLFALLGDSISYNITSNISKHEGPISLSISSSHLQANCPFYLTKDKSFLLTGALEAQITLTQQISEMFIKDINPLFIAGVISEHPITLHISPEGFILPLSPDLQKISINQGVLNIGQIFVVNGGKVQELMQFLKAKGVSREGNMSAWFTPIYFQLKDGTISYKRFDLLLASNVHLAFWGWINLVKDKVQMTLGIASSTLQRSFNINGVPNSQMFQIKVSGSTSNVELDWGAATARIAILVASSSVGQIGVFIGSILEKVYSALGEKPTPAPTTYPFPWAVKVES